MRDPVPVEGYELPVWFSTRAHPRGESGGEYEFDLSRAQVALVDELQAYYASVLCGVFPAAKWVVFRRGSRRDVRRGWPLLELHRKDWPAEPVRTAFIPAMRVVMGGEISGDFLVQKFDYDLPGWRENGPAA